MIVWDVFHIKVCMGVSWIEPGGNLGEVDVYIVPLLLEESDRFVFRDTSGLADSHRLQQPLEPCHYPLSNIRPQ